MSSTAFQNWIPLIGQTFKRWYVVGFHHRNHAHHPMLQCLCVCGAVRIVSMYSLLKGDSGSCGCLRRDVSRIVNTKHGCTGRKRPVDTEYKSWSQMKDRVFNPRCKAFKDYGGRGIKVCDRWRDSFAAFLADMGRKPSRNHTLDRIDNNGDYSPDNCRWATWFEQAGNTRRAFRITHNGKTLSASGWARESGLSLDTILRRIHQGKTGDMLFVPATR